VDVDSPALEDEAGRGSIVVLERLYIRRLKTKRRLHCVSRTAQFCSRKMPSSSNTQRTGFCLDHHAGRSHLYPSQVVSTTSCLELLYGCWAAQTAHGLEQHTNTEVSPMVRTAV
jgi:hypothetical protein